MKTFLMSSAAAILFAGTAFAQSGMDREQFSASFGENAFGAWDTDNDGMLSRAEFEAGVAAAEDADAYAAWDDRYAEWDADEDEMLTREEYEEGLWTHYDMDASGTLEEAEVHAWDEDEMRYDATRSGREVSPPG